MNSLFVFLAGFATSSITKIFNVLLYRLRVSSSESSKLFLRLQSIKHKKHIFNSTFQRGEYKVPISESSLRFLNIPFLLTFEEKELHAGFNAKETVCSIVTLSFFRSKLHSIIDELTAISPTEQKEGVKIFTRFYGEWIQTNTVRSVPKIRLSKNTETAIAELTGEFASGKRKKTGIILHGAPGNGKTSLVKRIAFEFGINVYVPVFCGDMETSSLVRMFIDIPPGKRIVLLEDFDSSFDGRTCLLKNVNFSFDAMLNCLDGVYCDLSDTLIILTTNNLAKIDNSLKKRPSRFDLIIEVPNPSYDERLMILRDFNLNGHSERIANLTDGQSASMVCEIAKRQLSEEPDILTSQISEIIESFQNE